MSPDRTDDPYRDHLDRTITFHLQQLESTARSLGERLLLMADDLERRGAGATINSLGEIQSVGSHVESQCGALAAAKDALKAYDSFNGVSRDA